MSSIVKKILSEVRKSSEELQASNLPSQHRIPEQGTFPAVRTWNGNIYFDDKGLGTHIEMIKQQGIPVEEIESGGWLTDGVYEGSGRSDTIRYVEQEMARKRSRENRDKASSTVRSTQNKSVDQTKTKEFKKWFGKSKVVDSSKKPKVVVHWTYSKENFYVFDPEGKENPWMADYPEGAIFFTDSPIGDVYGNRAYPVYLSIKKPLIVTSKGVSPEQYIDNSEEPWDRYYYKGDYDGIIVSGENGHGDKYSIYIVFDSTQIKSAIGNNGKFDPNNPNITESVVKQVLSQVRQNESADQTNTIEFKRWISNSKVRVPMYHWSEWDWDSVDMDSVQEGLHVGTLQAANERARGLNSIDYSIDEDGEEFWVNADTGKWSEKGPFKTKVEAQQFIKAQPKKLEPMKLWVRIENPIILPDLGMWSPYEMMKHAPKGLISSEEISKVMDSDDRYSGMRKLFLSKGIDGVQYENKLEDVGSTSYIVFSATQVKSATDNNGKFDPTNPNIYETKQRKSNIVKQVLTQVNQITEGVVADKIASVKNEKERKEWEGIFEETKKLFGDKMTYINWFFDHTATVTAARTLLKDLKHFYSYNLPAINNLSIPQFNGTVSLMHKLKEIEAKHLEKQKRVIPISVSGEKKVVHVCKNPDFVWFDLETCSSKEESDAMGHCGTDERGSTLYSLREKVFGDSGELVGYAPKITMTYSGPPDNTALQVKGYKNNKPSPKYMQFFVELIEEGIVDDIDISDSYLPFNDLYWTDFSKEDIERMYSKNKEIKHNNYVNCLLGNKKDAYIEVAQDMFLRFNSDGEPTGYWEVEVGQNYGTVPNCLASSDENERIDLPNIVYEELVGREDASFAYDYVTFIVDIKTRMCEYFKVAMEGSEKMADVYCKPFKIEDFWNVDTSIDNKKIIVHREQGAAIKHKGRHKDIEVYVIDGKPVSGGENHFMLSQDKRGNVGKYFTERSDNLIKIISRGDSTLHIYNNPNSILGKLIQKNGAGETEIVSEYTNMVSSDPYFLDLNFIYSVSGLVRRGDGKPSRVEKRNGVVYETYEVNVGRYEHILKTFDETTGKLLETRYMDQSFEEMDNSIFHASFIKYHPNGKVSQETWYEDGEMHRDDDEPAFITYDINGNIESQEYYEHGNEYVPDGRESEDD